MDRTNAPQQRDTVFCHECENEWYRDEHGISPCPECGSDFTEVIEPDHDPRDDHIEPQPQHQHGEFYAAPDPDEEDIDDIQWTRDGNGNMTGRGTIHRTITVDQNGQPTGGEQGVGGILGGLGQYIQGLIGQQLQPQQQQQDQQRQAGQDANTPQGGNAASAPGSPRGGGGTNVRHIHGPWGSMTIATSSNMTGNLYPRNANGPQPFQGQPDHIEQMMQQMLMNIMPMGPGGQQMHPPPPGMIFAQPGMPPPFLAGGPAPGGFFPANIFQLLGGMGMPGGGVHGDAVYSQEALDRIITQLMEQHHAGNAPGPATEAAIKALPTKRIDVPDLGDNGKAECSICMDEVDVGTEVTVLPCSHWFHGECIKAWLGEHDTCPHCRQGIMPKEGGAEGNRPREPSQAPLNDMTSPERALPQQMPGGFPGLSRQGSGSQANPFTVPDSPEMGRSASSMPGGRPEAGRQGSSSGAGIFGRMRDAFGGSGSGAAGGSGGGS